VDNAKIWSGWVGEQNLNRQTKIVTQFYEGSSRSFNETRQKADKPVFGITKLVPKTG
jgi:hypothetical protein